MSGSIHNTAKATCYTKLLYKTTNAPKQRKLVATNRPPCTDIVQGGSNKPGTFKFVVCNEHKQISHKANFQNLYHLLESNRCSIH